MIKAVIFIAIGAVGAYLYMNPGDVDGATQMLKQGVNTTATMVQEATQQMLLALLYSGLAFAVPVALLIMFDREDPKR